MCRDGSIVHFRVQLDREQDVDFDIGELSGARRREGVRPMRVSFFLWLPILVLATTVAGQAATAVTLSPTSGHASTVVAVSGTGFGDNEAVDVYVDTVDTLLLVASSTGSISGSVTIPASAAPGTHDITASLHPDPRLRVTP